MVQLGGKTWLVNMKASVCKNWKVFLSFQELCKDSCNMCNIMLQHEVMAVDECHDNGPKGLLYGMFVRYVCAFKMQSIKCILAHCPELMPNHAITACPRNTMHYLVQCKSILISEKNAFPKCQTPSKVSNCPLTMATPKNCS